MAITRHGRQKPALRAINGSKRSSDSLPADQRERQTGSNQSPVLLNVHLYDLPSEWIGTTPTPDHVGSMSGMLFTGDSRFIRAAFVRPDRRQNRPGDGSGYCADAARVE